MRWPALRANAPEVATPRVLARTVGGLFTVGGVAGLLDVAATHGAATRGDLVVAALACAGVAVGVLVLRWGARLPRWAYHVLQLQAIAMIASCVVLTSSDAAAASLATLSVFVAVDAFFFFAWPAAVAQLGVLVVVVGAAQLARGGASRAVTAADLVVLAAVAAVVGGLVQRASSATRDGLTGLANRRGFDERLAEAVASATRSGAPLSVALLDVDHFKRVNDSRGHAAGDALLGRLADDLAARLPAGALLARHGGDEFALLVPDARLDEALQLAEQLRAAAGSTSLSIGVAQLDGGQDAATLVRRADGALYEAKAAGRGRVCAASADGQELARDLAAAIAAGGIDVVLQPVVDPADGWCSGIEALARWTHPERGVVPPSVFVPVAESSGLVVALGSAVLRRACADAVRLRAELGRDLKLGVNASGLQLVDPGFVDDVLAALAATGWRAGDLVLEVTESAFDATTPAARATLEQLRAHGVAVGIDDFGTGYSSFSQLDALPADYLKLDATFTATVATSTRRAAMLTALLGLARDFGLWVVAEGVEHPEQARLLADLGCPLAQGYLFARPMPVDDLARHLAGQLAPGPPAPTAVADPLVAPRP